MTNTDIFDVLVVYTSHIAISASAANADNKLPFPVASKDSVLSEVYKFFIQECEKNNLKAAFTTTADILGAGKAKSYWKVKNDGWLKVKRACYAQQIFDKFSPSESIERDILLSSTAIKSFSNPILFSLFSDKLNTYHTFPQFAIPTIAISKSSDSNVLHAIEEIREIIAHHPNKQDFGKAIIMKDNFGSGGKYIHKIETDFAQQIMKIAQKNIKTSYVIQPYVKFDDGFRYKNFKGNTEIRLIFIGQKIVQTYIRVAKKNTFLCNQGIGGIMIPRKDIPKSVLTAGKKLARKLNKTNTLFALDFVVSNHNNIYLLEGNINPGIDWYPDFPENVKMNKKLIKKIVKELARRVHTDSAAAIVPNTTTVPFSVLLNPDKFPHIKRSDS